MRTMIFLWVIFCEMGAEGSDLEGWAGYILFLLFIVCLMGDFADAGRAFKK